MNGPMSDKRIRELCQGSKPMIEPFVANNVRKMGDVRLISYGLSSYGYDMRVAGHFKIFTNLHADIIDPKNFSPAGCHKVNLDQDGAMDFVIIPPNSFALAHTVEYWRIPDNVIGIVLGKSTYARCFSGDTKVRLMDGTAVKFRDMAESGKIAWGYGIDLAGRMVTTELSDFRLIGYDSLLEIELDNGEIIRCTDDHEFVVNTSWTVPCYKMARNLKVGESLRPLYTRNSEDDYEYVYLPASDSWIASYRLADEWNVVHGVYDAVPDCDRHHIDMNKSNNNPCNIIRLPEIDHIKLHNDIYYGVGFDAELHSLRIKNGMRHIYDNPDLYDAFCAEQSKRALNYWHNSKYAEQRSDAVARAIATMQSDEYRQRAKNRMIEYYANDANRAKTGDASKLAWANSSEERREKQREIARKVGLANKGRKRVNHNIVDIRVLDGKHEVFCCTSETGNFALDAGVFVHNCGLIANITALEPGWEGHLTIELSNSTPLPMKVYAWEGIAQAILFESDERCETSYADKNGKYQGQVGITTPKV